MIWAFIPFESSRSIFISTVSVNVFLIQPLIERTTVVKHTIYNNLHASCMNLLHNLCKKFIAGFKV